MEQLYPKIYPTPNKTTNAQTLFDTLTSLKREAFSMLDQALSIDASVKNSVYESAVIIYRKGLTLLDNAIDYYKTNKDQLSSMNDAVKVYNQLIAMRNQVTTRLDEIANVNRDNNKNNHFLDMSDDVLLIEDDDNDIIVLDEVNTEKKTDLDFENANEICRFENSVQLFFIKTDGTVTTPSRPDTMTLYTFNE